MIKRILIFGLATYSLGCKSTSVEGLYQSKVSHQSIQITKDKTYKYQYGYAHFVEYSTGYWTRETNKLIRINSLKSDSVITKISPIEDPRNEFSIELQINLIEKKGDAIYILVPIINGEIKEEITLKENKAILSYSYPIDSFQILVNRIDQESNILSKSIGTNVIKNSRENRNGYQIQLKIPDYLFNYVIFKNELIRIRKKSVLIYNKNSSQWEKLRRVSNELNVFSGAIDYLQN